MIDRASKNHPIQGSSADVTKLAMMFIRQEIIEHQLPVKMVMTVHDQIDTICKEDFAEEWAQRLTAQMVRAGSKVITNGLLGAETTISRCWQK
jgi:DNA polymerase I